ncbi:MAG: hypothetical protein JSS76_07650 [Bacteroidetes bacterium]|nr:hypothetical protein [Bacteroidota bacterium]
MKIGLIGTIAAIALIALYFIMRCKEPMEKSSDSEKSTNSTSDKLPKDNPYGALRHMALSVTSDALQLKLRNGDQVYGVITDMDMGRATVTLVAFQTGDASLYFSTGGGFLGNGSKPMVKDAAEKLVTEAQNYLVKAEKVQSTDVLPAKGIVVFYLKTNEGIYKLSEDMGNLEKGTSDIQSMFNRANDVITQIRLNSPN